MQHPLVNPSLTPHGFGAGNTYRRSREKSFGRGTLNGDWAAARFWDRANRLDLETNTRPAEIIVHEVMPGLRTLGRTEKGDFTFDGKPYQVRDLEVITAVAVWLGTNCGYAMLHNPVSVVPKFTKTNEFRVRWQEAEHWDPKGHLLRHILHECKTPNCGKHVGGHRYELTTEREELALDAFLLWLGTARGRTYIADLDTFIKITSRNMWEAYRRESTPETRRLEWIAARQKESA